MKTRRDFIRTTALGATVATVFPRLADGASASSSPVVATPPLASDNAITARHRNMYNGDTCIYFYNPEL